MRGFANGMRRTRVQACVWLASRTQTSASSPRRAHRPGTGQGRSLIWAQVQRTVRLLLHERESTLAAQVRRAPRGPPLSGAWRTMRTGLHRLGQGRGFLRSSEGTHTGQVLGLVYVCVYPRPRCFTFFGRR